MNLVQIGKTIINMDQVTDIHFDDEVVMIYFVSTTEIHNVELDGIRAEAFRDYLYHQAPLYVALSENQFNLEGEDS